MTPITSCFQSDPLEQKYINKCNVNVGENNTITCTHTYMKIRFQKKACSYKRVSEKNLKQTHGCSCFPYTIKRHIYVCICDVGTFLAKQMEELHFCFNHHTKCLFVFVLRY